MAVRANPIWFLPHLGVSLVNPQFSIALRGYEKEEVDRVISSLQAELEQVREFNMSQANEAETLKRHLQKLASGQ